MAQGSHFTLLTLSRTLLRWCILCHPGPDAHIVNASLVRIGSLNLQYSVLFIACDAVRTWLILLDVYVLLRPRLVYRCCYTSWKLKYRPFLVVYQFCFGSATLFLICGVVAIEVCGCTIIGIAMAVMMYKTAAG